MILRLYGNEKNKIAREFSKIFGVSCRCSLLRLKLFFGYHIISRKNNVHPDCSICCCASFDEECGDCDYLLCFKNNKYVLKENRKCDCILRPFKNLREIFEMIENIKLVRYAKENSLSGNCKCARTF